MTRTAEEIIADGEDLLPRVEAWGKRASFEAQADRMDPEYVGWIKTETAAFTQHLTDLRHLAAGYRQASPVRRLLFGGQFRRFFAEVDRRHARLREMLDEEEKLPVPGQEA